MSLRFQYNCSNIDWEDVVKILKEVEMDLVEQFQMEYIRLQFMI